MKAVLTGASGFIGRHLKNDLETRGWQIATLPRGTTQEAMVSLLSEFKPDVVFHLASLFIAEHKPNEVRALVESNILFGSLVVESMIQAGVRKLINTGTSWQHFGESQDEPSSLYAATKSAFDQIVRYYVSDHALKCTTLTIFDTYGAGDVRPKLIPKLIESFQKEQTLALSPGEQRIDFVHIRDVVRAYFLAAERLCQDREVVGRAEEFALSSGRPVRLRELVRLLEQIKGTHLSVEWGARPYRRREVMEPWMAGEILPGWRAEIALEDGLRELLSE